MGDWVDVPSNKTRTCLMGHHENNVVILGNDADARRFHGHAKVNLWGEDKVEIWMPGVEGDATYTDKRLAMEKGALRLRFWHERAMLPYHPKGEFQSRLHFEVGWAARPASNIYEFRLGGDYADFDFGYQTPFVHPAKFERDGRTWLRATDGDFEVERPIEIDGSYAVYHRRKRDYAKGGTNYRTGKALHILRPVAVDSSVPSRMAWVDLHIEGDRYVATVPGAFLDTATYPVRINDTMGYWSAGASAGGMGANFVNGHGPYTPAANGNATEVVLYTSAASQVFTMGIYDTDAGGPNNALRDCEESTSVAGGWVTGTLDTPLAIVNGTNYYLGAHCGGTTFNYAYDQPIVGHTRYYKNFGSYSAGVLGTPFPASPSTLGSLAHSIYANYTPAAAGGAKHMILGGGFLG